MKDLALLGGPRRLPKLAERIADRIVAEIIGRGWPTGEMVGTETELLVRYSISRATCRQAVRLVERHGAAKMRRGVGGGLFVSEPPRSAAKKAIQTFFELTRISFADLHEAREELEVLAVRLAAARIEPSKLVALASMVAALEHESDVTNGAALELRVRQALVTASGNPALGFFIEVLDDMPLGGRSMAQVAWLAHERERSRSIHFERRLVEAIARGNPNEAASLVAHESKRRLLAIASAGFQPLVEIATEVRIRRGADADDIRQSRIGDQLLHSILDDIAKADWREGYCLGTEAELMERHAVGRGTLREAVRQLELHGVVRSGTGMRGGVFVGHADADYTTKVVNTYLRSTEMDTRHIWEILSHLEASSAGRLALRAEPDDLSSLRQAFERIENARRENYYELSGLLHTEIADRTGNRVIGLFIRIFLGLSEKLLTPATDRDVIGGIELQRNLLELIFARDVLAVEREINTLFNRMADWESDRSPRAGALVP
jgi:DNA-binding FadR family transcriptional regulator